MLVNGGEVGNLQDLTFDESVTTLSNQALRRAIVSGSSRAIVSTPDREKNLSHPAQQNPDALFYTEYMEGTSSRRWQWAHFRVVRFSHGWLMTVVVQHFERGIGQRSP